jgi:hypothetical protein
MTMHNRLKNTLVPALLLSCCLLAACSSSSGTTTVGSVPQVHTVGSVTIDTANSVTVPVYWQGANAVTELSRIDPSCNGYANTVVVSGQDTHIAGTTFVCSADLKVRTPVAAYWKNGQRTDLDRPVAHSQSASEAQQVFLANGSVYIAGYVTGDNGPAPVYWKDGEIVYLTDIPNDTQARASNIYVDGSDVYVTGAALSGSPHPIYWKNGKASVLPVPAGYTGTSVPLPIGVSNGDVYIFGHFHRSRTRTISSQSEVPVYWKNGDLFWILSSEDDRGYSYGGTLYNGVPYTAGGFYEGTLYVPSVWTYTNRQRLSMIDEGLYGMAHDVFVDGSNVYVAGWTYTLDNPTDPASFRRAVPCYWSNSTRIDLPMIANKPAFVRGIFVTPLITSESGN